MTAAEAAQQLRDMRGSVVYETAYRASDNRLEVVIRANGQSSLVRALFDLDEIAYYDFGEGMMTRIRTWRYEEAVAAIVAIDVAGKIAGT